MPSILSSFKVNLSTNASSLDFNKSISLLFATIISLLKTSIFFNILCSVLFFKSDEATLISLKDCFVNWHNSLILWEDIDLLY